MTNNVNPQPTTSYTPLFILGNRTYDALRALVQYILPGLGTFYFTLATIWDYPNPDKVAATLAAITLLLGIVLAISRRAYRQSEAGIDGTLSAEPTEEEGIVQYRVQVPLEALGKNAVTLKVQPPV